MAAASTEQLFDLGYEYGVISASCAQQPAHRHRVPIGQLVNLPNDLWSGYSSGTSVCRVEGYIARLPWSRGKAGPAYVVRTLEDGHCYPFAPAALSDATRKGEDLARVEHRKRESVLSTASSSALLDEDEVERGGKRQRTGAAPAAAAAGTGNEDDEVLEVDGLPAHAPEWDCDDVEHVDEKEAHEFVSSWLAGLSYPQLPAQV